MDFFSSHKKEVWGKCLSESNNTEGMYNDLKCNVEDLLIKIDNLNENSKIPKEFINYLNNCLDKNYISGDVHTPCYYITKDGKSTFEHAPPEVHQIVYYHFKQAYNWIYLIEEGIENQIIKKDCNPIYIIEKNIEDKIENKIENKII